VRRSAVYCHRELLHGCSETLQLLQSCSSCL
jgi:hypothetical protein